MTAMLSARPLTLRQALAALKEWHRHHKTDRGHRWSIGACVGNELVGVVIAGRPKGPGWDHYRDIEACRLATNGHKNACSFLYGRAARAAREMGYRIIVTYTLESEPGTSLRAAGWICDGRVRRDGKGWQNRPGRQAENQGPKVRWHKHLNGKCPVCAT